MASERDKTGIDRRNSEAPRTNPEHSGVRTGNPQLDPEHARKRSGEGGPESREPGREPPR